MAFITPPPRGPDSPATAFAYSVVPAPDRDWLRGAADQARSLAYRTACDMIRVGRLLAEARDRIEARQFAAWVAAELPWSRSHAYRLIAVGELFGPLIDPAADERIDPTALYLLARAEVPPQARQYAVELAAEREVTATDAREILAAHRSIPEPTREDVKSHESRMKPVRDDKPPKPAVNGEEAVRRLATLEALVDRATILHITRIEDTDDDESRYSVTVYAEDDRPRNAVRRRLWDAIEAAAGAEEEKVCPGCNRTVPASLFGENLDLPDGRNRYCKKCERGRLAALKKKRKAAAKAAANPTGS